ncbi:MauE/DoxX family redox-associated membrane protein [Streptomyces sp. SudanB52_2052]|uniref:MauE/DoxX family redox-associated membrane protein n=1 Tax=Streptomyces sp. SudanB52_2052 TaxID=3035276 RepID=UPI003F57AAE9
MDHHVFIASRVLIGMVFAASLTMKLLRKNGWHRFTASVRGLAPHLPARTTAVAVCAAEASVALLIVPAGTAVYGLAGAVLLLLCFTVALVVALRRRKRVSCGCFGKSATPVSGFTVARNSLLTAGALAGIITRPDPTGAATPWPGTLTAIAVGAVAAALAYLTDELADLFQTRT